MRPAQIAKVSRLLGISLAGNEILAWDEFLDLTDFRFRTIENLGVN